MDRSGGFENRHSQASSIAFNTEKKVSSYFRKIWKGSGANSYIMYAKWYLRKRQIPSKLTYIPFLNGAQSKSNIFIKQMWTSLRHSFSACSPFFLLSKIEHCLDCGKF